MISSGKARSYTQQVKAENDELESIFETLFSDETWSGIAAENMKRQFNTLELRYDKTNSKLSSFANAVACAEGVRDLDKEIQSKKWDRDSINRSYRSHLGTVHDPKKGCSTCSNYRSRLSQYDSAISQLESRRARAFSTLQSMSSMR